MSEAVSRRLFAVNFGFNPSSVHVGFLVGKFAVRQFVPSISSLPSQNPSSDPPYLRIYLPPLLFNPSENVFKQRT